MTHLTLSENCGHTNEKFVNNIYKFNVQKINIVTYDRKITVVTNNKLMV